VTELGAEKFLGAAEEVALAVAEKIGDLLPCAKTTKDDACLAGFVADFARRAYRRPPTDAEREVLVGLAAKAKGDAAFADSIALVVSAVLQSPQFLYRSEVGREVEPSVFALTDHEIAARLSYLLWDTMPDATLASAADRGELGSGAAIRAQAERMLGDPRAARTLGRFTREWLHTRAVGPDDKDDPAMTPALATAFDRELQLFAEGAFLSPEGSLATLLAGRRTRVNRTLAAFYGLPLEGRTEDRFDEVELDRGQRAGILTLPAFLAAQSHAGTTSYVLRGVAVRKRVLCEELPDPPANAQAMVPATPASATEHEKSAAVRGQAVCAGCHNLIDPVGLAFESYDPLGRFRARLPDGRAIPTAGDVPHAADDVRGAFDGVPALAERLSTSGTARRCVSRQWFRFAHGRVDGAADRCAIDRLEGKLVGGGGRLRSLVLALTEDDAFRFRRLAASSDSGGSDSGGSDSGGGS
jgi:hypothetical protein